MSDREMAPAETVRILEEAVALIARLPEDVQCGPWHAVMGALCDTAQPLADLSTLLRERGPQRVATLEVERDGVCLRYCTIGIDHAGWPVWLSVEMAEHFRGKKRAFSVALNRARESGLEPDLADEYTEYAGWIAGNDAKGLLSQLRGEKD